MESMDGVMVPGQGLRQPQEAENEDWGWGWGDWDGQLL